MKYIYAILALLLMSGCKKESDDQHALVSLNVVNAVVQGSPVKLNSNTVDSARTYNYRLFTIVAEENPLVKLYPTSDPSTAYVNGPLFSNAGSKLHTGDIYSVYLCGDAVNAESIIIQDVLPAFYPDSSIGIRFINLSPNSTDLHVTLASNSSEKVFDNIGYKQLTGFVKFPVPTNTTANSVTFQVRNAAGVLQKSYTIPLTTSTASYPSLVTYPNTHLPISRFKHQTLVIRGLVGNTSGADAFGIFPVNNF